jgi:uncharacterized protein (DUF2141 family)
MINRCLIVPALLFLAYPRISAAALPSLTVHVRNALPPTGTVEVTLFNSEESFLKEIHLQQSGKANESGEFTAEFAGIEEGEYAVVVVHDENGNQIYDAGFLGFGTEGLGYSNNGWSWFGRPDFNEVKFTVDSEYTEIEIILD